MAGLHERGRGRVGPAPDVDLLLPVLLHRLLLVQALKPAVHALVEAPVLMHGEVPAARVGRIWRHTARPEARSGTTPPWARENAGMRDVLHGISIRGLHLIHVFEDVPRGLDGPLEDRGVHHIELELLLLQLGRRTMGLGNAAGCKRHVHPPSETVLNIPLALAVADEDECVHLGVNAIQSEDAILAHARDKNVSLRSRCQ